MPDRHAYGSYSLGDDWPETPPPSRGLPAGLASAADQLRRLESEQQKRVAQQAAQEQAEIAARDAEHERLLSTFQPLISEILPLLRYKDSDDQTQIIVKSEKPKRWYRSDTTIQILRCWRERRISEVCGSSALHVFENGDWNFFAGLRKEGRINEEFPITVCSFSLGLQTRNIPPSDTTHTKCEEVPNLLITPEVAFSEFQLTLAALMKRLRIS